MDFWISEWISGFQIGFLDFTVDFWISGFQFGFLDFSLDFWISVCISADGVRDFFRDGPLVSQHGYTYKSVTTCDACAADHVVRFSRPSPPVFAYCKRSKTGAGEGLGTRLPRLFFTCGGEKWSTAYSIFVPCATPIGIYFVHRASCPMTSC